MERAVELELEDLATLIGLGYVHARAGNRDRALELVAETEARGGASDPSFDPLRDGARFDALLRRLGLK